MPTHLPASWSSVVFLLCAFSAVLGRAADEDLSELEERAMRAAVARVAPSVVRIETIGGLERVESFLVGEGPTTGLVVAEDGYVISSAFNFVQKPNSILVTLESGQRVPAEIVARDHSRMLVLLKVHTDEKLVPPELAPSPELFVGQWTLAVGRTYDPLTPNTSAGILSAKNRIWGRAIQTDAKISPSNYGGPLVDIRGRVIGVLVPMSPDGQNELAGAQWYDSGIGFAVPLADMLTHLPRMKAGEDLHPGLLGVTLIPGSVYSEKPEIAACKVRSPADLAGLRVGDVIVEVDGQAVVTQAQLKHALGPRYAGDEVRIAVLRDGQRIEVVVTLASTLLPYQHPFLGLLPQRQVDEVVVRHVYPGSGADEAGLRVGDRIVALDGTPVASAAVLRGAVAQHEIGDRLKIKIQRDNQPGEVEAALGELPTEVPADLPPARADIPLEGERQVPLGAVDIKIPEEPNACLAVVPNEYNPRVAYGLLVYLHAPGQFQREAFVERWRERGGENDLIVIAPQPQDAERWQRTEVDFIKKTIEHVLATYHVDPTRVVIHGYQAGGAIGYLTAFAHRDVVRGLSVADASMPLRTRVPDNDPLQRLAFFSMQAPQSPLAARMQRDAEQLSELKYPVTVQKTAGPASDLNDEQLGPLLRWIDTLDRI